jgi:hypothetical protein
MIFLKTVVKKKAQHTRYEILSVKSVQIPTVTNRSVSRPFSIGQTSSVQISRRQTMIFFTFVRNVCSGDKLIRDAICYV